MSTADLPDAIEQHGLSECIYLFVRCWTCGELRAAVAEIPESRFMPCPSCNQEAEYKICGNGGTTRNLPFFERGGHWLPVPSMGRL
jgi:hypothetical protein